MASEEFKRKLTAVFSADAAGYSRLMGENEEATVRTLETYRQVMFTLIKQHRGRVIDSPGDNLLAEFASVVDAVQCGVAVQKELQSRNADLPENRKMQFRIGINLGDVIEEGERIYGDGVNIAARLEALATPGGICVSKTAFDHIESKLPLGYEYLGEQTVKNIARPVGAYRVLLEPRITVVDAVRRKTPSKKRRLVPVLAGILIVVGALALWQFLLKPVPPDANKPDPKKIAAQVEAQKQETERAQRAAEDSKREAALQAQVQAVEEKLRRFEQDQKLLETERRAADKTKEQARVETRRLQQEERNRLEQERIRLESEKRAVEAAKQQMASAPAPPPPRDGYYTGELCNQWMKPPFRWPVALVVRGGIAEGGWISQSAKKKARAFGAIADDGSVQLVLEAWAPNGAPVEAKLLGRLVDGAITASGKWSTGGEVSGEWKLTR